jgi:hypothetical protein
VADADPQHREKDHANAHLYKRLFALKKRNTALNTGWGATIIAVPNSAPPR